MPLNANTYLSASVAVGVAQVIDAVALVKYKGRIGAVATFFSIAECGWAAVSFFVWRAAEGSVPYWLPVSFIAYVASFFAVGFMLAAQSRDKDMPIPTQFVVAGGLFGVYFAVASALYAAGA